MQLVLRCGDATSVCHMSSAKVSIHVVGHHLQIQSTCVLAVGSGGVVQMDVYKVFSSLMAMNCRLEGLFQK